MYKDPTQIVDFGKPLTQSDIEDAAKEINSHYGLPSIKLKARRVTKVYSTDKKVVYAKATR